MARSGDSMPDPLQCRHDLRAGVDLGGTKVQTVVVDEQFSVLGQMRMPTPDHGRPAGRRRHDRRDDPRGLPPGRHRAGPARLDRRRLAGRRRRRERHRHAAPATSRTGRAPSRSAARCRRRSARPSRSATTSTSRRWPSSTSAPASPTARCSASSGAPASAAASCSTASSGSAATPRARSATWSSSSAARKCPCGRHGCMEAYAGRGAMETRARELVKKGEQTDLFEIMEKRGRDAAHQRDLGARAGAPAIRWPCGSSTARSRRSAPASRQP